MRGIAESRLKQRSAAIGGQSAPAASVLHVLIGGHSVSNGQLSAIRRIGRTPFTTPMLVPSYSSRGFPVGSIFELLSPYTTSTCLISAYDIYHRLLPRRALFASDLVFVEQELGRSILERARNIARIRRALVEIGNDLPIHIFGCLDPGLVRYYAMAGADIFDGLQWLRNVITEGGTIRMSTVIVR